jgi:ParB family transcriptional regulator, chromosome partitioning protein
MTTSAAENTAGRAGEKDKVEKRRALGRGLESLLPGPRVVAGGATPGTSGAAGKPQVPHFVRNDKTNEGDRSHVVPNDKAALADRSALNDGAVMSAGAAGDLGRGEAIDGVIRAEVEDAVMEGTRAGAPSTTAQGRSAPHDTAEPRSAGQPGAAVPTWGWPGAASATPFPAPSAFPGADSAGQAGADETITIYAQAESRIPGNLVVNVAIADIDRNPFQTRHVGDDEALEELADSIKANGVVQPIMVRPGDEDGRYILILGERRLHASKKAGKTHIPALVRRVSLQQAAEMTIVENLQREDLSALEQAEAFRVLSNEFHLTQQQIGERVGLSRASVTNYMRLLKLPRDVMQLLAEKKINFAQAKELLKLEGDDKIAEAALYAVKKGMTLEQVEMLVLRMNGLLDPLPGMPGLAPKKSGGARWVDPNVRSAQMDLERMLGVRVRIRDRKGKGKIVIEYHTVDDYERVVEMLRGKK